MKIEQNAIISLYLQTSPASAFVQGVDESKDKMFIPSKKNRAAAIKKADALIQKAKTKKERIALQAIRNEIEFFEPFRFINGIGSIIFGYSVKGVAVGGALEEVKKGMRVLINEYTEPPAGIKILCARAIDNTISGLKTTAKDKELISLLQQYRSKLDIHYALDKKNILERMSAKSLGREKNYAQMLAIYNITDKPQQIEKKCLKWMNETKPAFDVVVKAIKKKYGLKSIAEIDAFLLRKTSKNILKTAAKWRKKLTTIVGSQLIDISPRHKVELVVTPKHLQTNIAVAGAMPTDTLAGKFNNYLFLTKEAKINDYFLVDVLIHEEFGHNVNFSNSLDAEISDRLYFIPTTFSTAEVIATYLEYRFFVLSKELPFDKEFKLFYSYVVLRRFLIVYLRAIADVRINTGKSSLGDFMTWANKKTGVDKEFLFTEMMSKLYSPGYAIAYPLGMHALEELRKKSNLSEKKFNTKVWSMGFPPLEIFLETLRE